MNKFVCECGMCKRTHEFGEEYVKLFDIFGSVEAIVEADATILLKDCDNGGYPFFQIAETEHLKMGISMPMGAVIHEINLEEFQPLHKTILN